MSPSHQRLTSQKLSDNIDAENNYEEISNKYEEFNEIYQKQPMKLMQTYTDGHLGTYAPSKNGFFMIQKFFFISHLLSGRV